MASTSTTKDTTAHVSHHSVSEPAGEHRHDTKIVKVIHRPISAASDCGSFRKSFHNEPFDTGMGERKVAFKIHFNHKFPSVPKVVVSLSGIECVNTSDIRIRLAAESITTKDFVLVMSTWIDTTILYVEASWIAML
eukprot:TRINITY_DN5072_c0_g1_i1.p1 TRINITY_DN5072_c0_g1~~TRINITY_DN5072_c0_g1_i1.p1  ORF type:complete len:136 (+),score=24.89 TRINITY_DN5072_c0_g1_i1:125-532(+)